MTDQENWYKTFFKGMAIELWHNAVPPEYTAKELEFIKNEIHLKPGSAILDVPCGSGRHALWLARQGFSVTGIDISAGNIDLLNKERGDLPVHPVCADILAYRIHGKYNLAICLGNSFGYFPYEKMVAFVQKIYNVLLPGAKFILHSGTIAESLLPALKEKNRMTVGAITFEYDNSYDETKKVLRTDMRFKKEDKTENAVAYHHVFTLAQVNDMLISCGFGNVIAYSGFERAVYKAGDSEAYIVAEK